jgi:hypothetical protein
MDGICFALSRGLAPKTQLKIERLSQALMNLKTVILGVSVAGAMAFGAVESALAQSPYPLVKVNLSGTVSYSPNYGNQSLEVPLKTASYNNKTLISLLNASAYASNIIFSVTSSNQIPAGSYFLFDPDAGTLALTNNSGFYFPLADAGYSFGSLEIDESQLIGTYSLNTTTLAGSETDKTGFYFEFEDGADSSTEILLYGTATLTWKYGAANGAVQSSSLSVSMNGKSDNGSFVLQFFDGVTAAFSASGSGSLADESTTSVPFFTQF